MLSRRGFLELVFGIFSVSPTLTASGVQPTNWLLAPLQHLCESQTGLGEHYRRCGEMADAQDLKSWAHKKACGFESHHRHHLKNHS